MENRKLNVMFYGASKNLTTGYAKLVKYVGEGLEKYNDLEIFYFGLQSIGLQEGNNLPLGDSMNGSDMFNKYIMDHKIDIVITYVDNWDPSFEFLQKTIQDRGVKWICHVTINSTPMPDRLKESIAGADLWIAPTDFVRDEMIKVGFNGDKVKTIYHGVNTEIFNNKVKSNTKFIPNPNNFLFLSVGVNKFYQKNLGGLVEGFSKFIKRYNVDDANLLMCTEINSSDGIPLGKLIEKCGIAGKVFCTTTMRNIGYTEKEMAEVYASSDSYVITSLGESFSLPLIESMACGLPCLGTDFSANKEHIENSGAGETIKVANMFWNLLASQQAWIDTDDLAKKMYKIYSDKGLRKEMSKKGIEYAKKHTWELKIPIWYDCIKTVIDSEVDYINLEFGI